MGTARRAAVACAGVLAMLVTTATAGAEAPPSGDDPVLAALLLTVDDLPPGWQPFVSPMPPPSGSASGLDDPCVALLHRFDAAYAEPHAIAGFMSGSFGVLAQVVFRLESPEAATELVESHIGDLAGCPVLTGADGRGTTFTSLPFPELGDLSAASRGDWELGGIVLLHSVVAAGDLVITVDISGQGGDPALLTELTTVAVERALGATPAGEGAAADDTGGSAGDKPDPVLPSG